MLLLRSNCASHLKYLDALNLEATWSNRLPQLSSIAGTKVFMAIGVLKGEHHNTMHDLESFFWVLFWICIHWNGPSQERRKVKEFKDWNTKPIRELAKLKMGLVSEEDGFAKEMSENFSERCKPLISCIQELREVVFPGGKRRLSEDRELYSRMTDIIRKARKDLELQATGLY